jgi:hypothetical protein
METGKIIYGYPIPVVLLPSRLRLTTLLQGGVSSLFCISKDVESP